MKLFPTAGLTAVLTFGALVAGQADAQVVKTITSEFEVTIHQRANPTDEPFSVIGLLTMDIESDGSFTGTITPARDTMGGLMAAVIFNGKSQTSNPDAPTTLRVFGQATGRSINIGIELPNKKFIFGTGTSRDNLNTMVSGEMTGIVGGSAVTSDSGERGDWISYKFRVEIVPCPAGCTALLGGPCVVCVRITGYIEF